MRWSQARTSAQFAPELTSSEFAPPNVFVFGRDRTGDYPFDVVSTNFPFDNKIQQITFPPHSSIQHSSAAARSARSR